MIECSRCECWCFGCERSFGVQLWYIEHGRQWCVLRHMGLVVVRVLVAGSILVTVGSNTSGVVGRLGLLLGGSTVWTGQGFGRDDGSRVFRRGALL